MNPHAEHKNLKKYLSIENNNEISILSENIDTYFYYLYRS